MKNIQATTKHRHHGTVRYKKNPMNALIKNGLAVQVGNGLFVLKGPLVRILERIEKEVMKIARSVAAEQAAVPSILSRETMEASQYLKSFGNQAMLLSLIKNAQPDGTELIQGLASPTVCYHYFSSLSNGRIQGNHAVTALGKCTRKEEGVLNDLSRITNYTMREVIFLGDEVYCSKMQQKILAKTITMLDTVFDLSYEVVTANDPFFGEGDTLKQQAQLLAESKYEVQALLPFKHSSVSVASFNNHGGVFYDRFSIQPKKGDPACSGCVGWGYERILFAILSQQGVNFASSYYQKLHP